MSSRKDYYKILKVDRDASINEIKKAYRKLALKHHPDKSTHPDATKTFQDINEAYSILSDPRKRRRYDSGYGSSSNFNDYTSFHESYDNFTMDDAFNVFSDFMYGGDIPDIFREENMEYHLVEVPLSVAQNGGDVEIYIERERETKVVHIDGILSGRWKPFISLGDHYAAILKVSFPPEMSLAERRRLQKMFLGLQAISLVTKAVFDTYSFLGVLGLGAAALVLFLGLAKKWHA